MKDETKFTPGPWLVAGNSPNFVYALNDYGTNIFSLLVSSAGRLDKDEAGQEEVEANAALIATAPCLFKALQEAVDLINESSGGPCPPYPEWLDALSRARGES